MKNKNYIWINKLDLKSRDKIRKMFVLGLSVSALARKFNVHRSTIYYYCADLNPEVKKQEMKIDKPIEVIPEKKVSIKYIKIKLPKAKTYNQYLKEEKKRRKIKNDCLHRFWTRRCCKCYSILETETCIKEIFGKCAHTNWNKKCSGCGKKI